MLCPKCRKPMGEMCEDCGVFVEKPEFVVTDLSDYKIRHQRVYKKGDHFKEVLSQFQGREGKTIPKETLDKIRADLAENKTVTMELISMSKTRFTSTTWSPGKNRPT